MIDLNKLWLAILSSVVLPATCAVGAGCSAAYPKVFDSPEMQQAIVQTIKESNKTWQANSRVSNPEIEFYYKLSVGARVIGVDGEIGAQGAAGPNE